MKVSTGIPLFNGPVDPQGTENQSNNVLFSSASTSLTSHVIDVSETAIVVKAYGLTSETITVNTFSYDGIGNLTAPMKINGKTVELSADNNILVIDISGRYTFTLSGSLGVISCVFHESGMSYWSYGLSDFALAP
jgi:hypothetical protein